jgi:hypothetical protein
VIFETGFEFTGLYIFRAEVVLAGARRIHLADEFEHGLHGLHRRIRPIVLTAIAREVPQAVYAREAFLSNGDVRIALIVLKVDVIAGLMLFDQIVFQEQRIPFGIRNNGPYICDFSHHGRDACAVVVFREIRTDPFAQILCFANVENLSILVHVLVYSWFIRKGFEQVGDVFASRHESKIKKARLPSGPGHMFSCYESGDKIGMLLGIHYGDGSIDHIFIVVGSVQQLKCIEIHTISQFSAAHVGSAPWVRIII